MPEAIEADKDAGKPAYPIGSVDSALRLLLMVVERQQLRISEASDELGVARSTAHRLMQMLQFHGFVRQDDDSKIYTAGPVLFDMGLQIVRNLDVRSHARPSLEAVARDLEETVQLFVIQHDGRLICIDAVESQRPVRVAGRVGLALPPTSTASGRAILSQMTPDRRTQILGSAAVKAHKGLDRELDAVKKRGYAVQSGEGEPEVSAVSAPIIDARGLSAFAVTIALPTSRFDERTTAQIGTAAVRCAAEIALALPW